MKNMDINFDKSNGLVPAVIQDNNSGEVLMIGFMNQEALKKTLDSGWVYFWSRSRNKLWKKGEESGNRLKVRDIYKDCDQDALLIKVDLVGKSVCHTGNKTCFYQEVV